MFVRHSIPGWLLLNMVPCPDVCIAPTAADTCTSSPQAAITSARCRELRPGEICFLKIMEQVRLRYSFVVVGYVVMPEHIHLLISEPDRGTPSTFMQVLKQRFARRVLAELRRKERVDQRRLWQ